MMVCVFCVLCYVQTDSDDVSRKASPIVLPTGEDVDNDDNDGDVANNVCNDSHDVLTDAEHFQAGCDLIDALRRTSLDNLQIIDTMLQRAVESAGLGFVSAIPSPPPSPTVLTSTAAVTTSIFATIIPAEDS